VETSSDASKRGWNNHRRRAAPLLAWLILLAAATAIQSCGNDAPPQRSHVTFKFEPGKGLSPEERGIENRFGNAIAENLNVFIAAYRWKWPKIINTDNARELCGEYAPDGFDLLTDVNRRHRTKHALGTQAPARALAMEVYKQMLREPPANSEQPLVVFTAGGAGSGKSTSVAAVEEVQRFVGDAQIIVDTTLTSPVSLEQVTMALDAQKSVKIYYIYRDPESAFQGVIDRAKQTGRPVTISNFIETHLGAPVALDNVARKFAEEIKSGRIDIKVVDNTGDIRDANLSPAGVRFVRERTARYSHDQLRDRLRELLRAAYENNAVSKDLVELMDR